MKKIIASAGLVAIGAAGLQAAYAPGLTPSETAKPWSISATLRGFYDDNYTTAPKGSELDSFGFQVRPGLALNFPMDQTFIGFRYIYDLKYYDDRDSDKIDHTHQFDAILSHTFSERYSIDLNDSFAIAQEPELLSSSTGPFDTLVRSEGDNIRNRGSANFNAQLTRLVSLLLGYSNTFIDYEQDESDLDPFTTTASRSYLLDRMEHLAKLEAHWQALRQTVAIVGYQYGMINYSSDETLNGLLPSADARNSRSHYFYLGADHSFRSDLSGSVRLGGQHVDFYNDAEDDPTASPQEPIISPYADANLTYTYNPGSFVQLGVRHARNATDVTVLDQESTGVYLQLNHRITPNLTGNLLGQYQHSVNNGSVANVNAFGTDFDDTTDAFYLLGLNLSYRFNQFFSAEAGYNYDRLSSDISGRSFIRNRVYVGVTASY